MLRSVPVIVSAILMSRPTMPYSEAVRYAHVVQQEALARDFDPFTAVAIIHFESRWRPSAVSPDREDYGLGQVRARFTSGCRGDADPVNAPSAACLASKAALLSGENNIRRMASIITANRELCRDKVGSAWFPQWLAGYQGMNRPGAQKWCTPGDKTFEVIAYQKKLAGLFSPKPSAAVAEAKVPREHDARVTQEVRRMRTEPAGLELVKKVASTDGGQGQGRRRAASRPQAKKR